MNRVNNSAGDASFVQLVSLLVVAFLIDKFKLAQVSTLQPVKTFVSLCNYMRKSKRSKI